MDVNHLNEATKWQCLLLFPVFDTLCTYLEPPDLLAIRRTTKEFAALYSSAGASQFKINLLLKRFVKDPIALRSTLATHHALISGSAALQLFERVVWSDSDLDIYVENDENNTALLTLCDYFIRSEGYAVKIVDTQITYDDMRNGTINKIDTLAKNNKTGKEVQVKIIGTKNIPLEAIVATFYTTAVVNFITWNAAYSIFPDLTFIKRSTYQLTQLTPFYGEQVAKYGPRGWKLLETVSDGDHRHTKSLRLDDGKNAERRVGDSFTWKIDLDINGVTPGAPSSVIEHCFFAISRNEISSAYAVFHPEPERYSTSHYVTHMSVFKSCVLKYQYLTNRVNRGYAWKEERDTHRFFWKQQAGRLNELTRIECDKLPEDERPVDIVNSVEREYYTHAAAIRRNPPEGWTFWDSEVPEWFKEYEKERRGKVLGEEKRVDGEVNVKEREEARPVNWGYVPRYYGQTRI